MANGGMFLWATFLSYALFGPLLVSAHHGNNHHHHHRLWRPHAPGLDIINRPVQDFDDFARIIKGIEGGESLPLLLKPGMQKPKRQEQHGLQAPSGLNPVDGSGNGAQQQIESTSEHQILEPAPGAQISEPTPGAQIPEPLLPNPTTPGALLPEPTVPGALLEGFYEQSCPQAEQIVSEVINKNFQKDPTLAPALIRLFFHDCFVTGCDASILLDRTPTGEPVEKMAPQNGMFVHGFDALDEAKARLEAECPGVVSCADLLAFANRDSLVFTGVPSYPVPAGRRDSRASLAKNTEADVPFPESTGQEMIQLFERKGLTVEEMVVLTGAHSVGSAHCTVVAGRFRDPGKAAGIDRGYLMKMQVMTACLNDTQDIAFDPLSQQKMDSRFYKQLLKNRALLESDQNLVNEPSANLVMRRYADDQNGWMAKFVASITKLGAIEVLTGNQGEIRRQCRAVN
ncbi:Peroxidase 39 [Striga hermonthica]|uniref:peroxidase n=1 Tax=Striga hermonthica TaxID=68872 RepID=A0A9N7RJB4_STRHE|nr:Peroxidase 39 [Striga hermonthica]